MAKRPSISTISSGYASTTTLNDNFEALQEAFDNTISRDGSTPNTMSADLDMNGNDIIGASSVLVGGVDYLAQSLAYKNAAETAKTAAEAAKVAAELAYDNFDDRYLGVKTSDPSTDNDGNALLDGALFFDTTLNVLKVYDQGNTSWKRTTPTTSEQANIDTVTGISSDVTTVAGVSANVTTVAGSIADVNSVATNMAEVLTADTNAATATTKAAEASASATAAANSATSASGSATTASNQATAAATSASTATTQAGISTTKATESAASAAAALASKNAAATSATNSATSESNAATSATASETSRVASVAAQVAAETAETNAETAETNAAASASSASTSASNASTSASDAATSATSAAASYDSFDDRYLGVKTTAPSTDNDGDALTTGCLYYNSTVGQLYIWDGSAWDDAALSASGAVTAFNTRTGSVTLNSTDVLNASGLLNTGGTMTGALVLNADPSVALGAATKQYVDTEVAGIVDSAPATLDTLNELAAALGDDANFSTTVTNNIATKVSKSGDSMTGNLSFGDNDKAIFGAGSDLQIFHDPDASSGEGSVGSYIKEAGTGDLRIRASNLQLQSSGGERYMTSTENGASVLFYDDNSKLATTSTGIDVTGTVTADGLTVDDGFVIVNDTTYNNQLRLESGNSYAAIHADPSNSVSNTSLQFKIDGDAAMQIASNGDISFYEDTGTTPKFFWDASAESLGIGTSSPDYPLHVKGTSNILKLETSTNSRTQLGGYDASGNANFLVGSNDSTNTEFWNYKNGYMRFATNSTERMRIDSSGNLLVGSTNNSPATNNVAGSSHGSLGNIQASVDGNPCLFVNRKSNDGDIISIRKDGSAVASIGVAGSDLIISGKASSVKSGIRFDNSTLTPAMNGVDVDASVDLGYSARRFKDGYFSGTVNAANFNTTSDATLKTNVETLTGSLDAVKSLRGVSFDWLENGNSEVGVIAQEVEAVLPDVVSTDDQGIKSVKYGNMVALLIEAMKEQQLRIEALEAKLGE